MNGIHILSPTDHQEVLKLLPGQFALAIDCRSREVVPKLVPAGQPILRRESSLWVLLQQEVVLDSCQGLQHSTGLFNLTYSQTIRVAARLPDWSAGTPQNENMIRRLPLIMDSRNFVSELQQTLRPVFADYVTRHPRHFEAMQHLDSLLDIEPTYFAEQRAEYERRATYARNMLGCVESELRYLLSDWILLCGGLIEAQFAVERCELLRAVEGRFQMLDLKIDKAKDDDFRKDLLINEVEQENMRQIMAVLATFQPRLQDLPALIESLKSLFTIPTGPRHRPHVPLRHGSLPSHVSRTLGTAIALPNGLPAFLAGGLPALPPATNKALSTLEAALQGGTADADALEGALQCVAVRNPAGKPLNSTERATQLRAWLDINHDPSRPAAESLHGFFLYLVLCGCELTESGDPKTA